MRKRPSVKPILTSLCFISILLIQSCGPFIKREKFDLEGKGLYDRIARSHLPWSVWAKSVEGRNIYLLDLGEGEKITLIFGAFHGNELLSGELVYRFSEYLHDEMRQKLDCKVILVPIVNPDGLIRGKRTNANDVDINRNFPTENWSQTFRSKSHFPGSNPGSEPETRAVIQLLKSYPPDRIISIHTPLTMVNFDGPAHDLANRMSKWNGYPVQGDIGYPTPGSFGTYAGIEKNIPTITLELGVESFKKVWQKNRNALLEALLY